jgi:hypothetical protein
MSAEIMAKASLQMRAKSTSLVKSTSSSTRLAVVIATVRPLRRTARTRTVSRGLCARAERVFHNTASNWLLAPATMMSLGDCGI